MDGGQWTSASRNQYNLRDAVSRCTTQVSIINLANSLLNVECRVGNADLTKPCEKKKKKE